MPLQGAAAGDAWKFGDGAAAVCTWELGCRSTSLEGVAATCLLRSRVLGVLPHRSIFAIWGFRGPCGIVIFSEAL